MFLIVLIGQWLIVSFGGKMFRTEPLSLTDGRNYCTYITCFVGRRIEKTMDSQNKVKNIIFDLGCILVELHPQRCIDSFRSLGAEAVAKYIETHQTRDLFYHIEVGKITNCGLL